MVKLGFRHGDRYHAIKEMKDMKTNRNNKVREELKRDIDMRDNIVDTVAKGVWYNDPLNDSPLELNCYYCRVPKGFGVKHADDCIIGQARKLIKGEK